MKFNFHLFKSYLSNTLSFVEFKFLIKTFSYAAFYFLSFGFFISTMLLVDNAYSFLEIPFIRICGIFISIASTFALFFYFFQYQANPLGVKKTFIQKIFSLLFISYTFVFLFAFKLLASMIKIEGYYLPALVFGVFSITFCCYLIPVFIGLYLKSHKTILTFMQFLKYCYLIYGVLFIVMLISYLVSFKTWDSLSMLLFLFMGIIIFSSPVLTMYRLKNTIKYIDHSDEDAVYKWEMFFTFEILVQLMQMAIYIIRLLIILLGRGGRR